MPTRHLSLFVGPLLDRYAHASTAERPAIEHEIWHRYGQEMTVMVLDMSGFSLLTQRHGIIYYLSMVRRMQLVIAPLIARHGGEIVKFEADNGFAIFDEPLPAARAARDIHATLAEDPHAEKIRVSIGIDCGKVLLVDHQDVFGNPVNRASKLGEDIGEAGETLITAEAFARLPAEEGLNSQRMRMTISGIEIELISL